MMLSLVAILMIQPFEREDVITQFAPFCQSQAGHDEI